ncbi:hypothetical protein BBJ28_00004250 [Nothophytophthora sp. Chile5]|nr:hypothetical protein BBJ28_00004250 [Nothophytophthora sp. Chile5]
MFNTKMCRFSVMSVMALMAGSVKGHGYLGLPAVSFPDGVDPTQFSATIESSASGFSGSFSGSPADNTAAFTTAFNASSYSSLKEFVTKLGQIVATGANIECGLTDPNETPQPLPETYIEWTHSSTEGFTSSHEGPCEAWCDDTRVFHDDDCAAHYTTAPAKMPYDREACSGASRLTFYWLALHSSTWQVYVDCAALESGSSSANTPSVTAASGSGGQVATPTATTATPSSGGSIAGEGDEEDCGSLDIAGSDAEEDCGSLDIAGSEDDEDCGSLDVAGSEADEATTVSESSLNFDNMGGSYTSGKVQAEKQSA